jgi:septum formation topological specificity factor MinE
MGRASQRAEALRARMEQTLVRDRSNLTSGNLTLFQTELRRLIERFFPAASAAAEIEVEQEGEELRVVATFARPQNRT